MSPNIRRNAPRDHDADKPSNSHDRGNERLSTARRPAGGRRGDDVSNVKPIKVFYSDLREHGTFYATQHYREEVRGDTVYYTITGRKYDVTQDIAEAIVKHDIEFVPADQHGEGEDIDECPCGNNVEEGEVTT